MSAARRVKGRGKVPETLPRRRRVRQDPTRQPIRLDFAQCPEVLVCLRAAGGPWWACCLVVALVVSAQWLRIVFPQESYASSPGVNDGERGDVVADGVG
jgi:hypothetical protein